MNDSKTSLPPLDQVVPVMRERHDRDVSGYDESFLAKSLEQQRLAAGGETPPAYLEGVRHHS